MERSRHRLGFVSRWILLALVASGCSGRDDDLPREPISGKVTFGGQPLRSGVIQFQPATAQEGIASGGIVTDGSFQVERKDGPVPGKYLVMIFAKGDPGENPPPPPAENVMPGEEPPKPKRPSTGKIPSRYNLETELIVQVEAGGRNEFTFVLDK